MTERPSEIALIVRRKPQLGAVPERAREGIERRRTDDAATMMTQFRPWVRKKHEQASDGGFRQARDDDPCVALQDADVREIAIDDMAKQARDAVQERLDADEAGVGICRRLPRQMLAAAKTDLEPKIRLGRVEQRPGIERPIPGRQG